MIKKKAVTKKKKIIRGKNTVKINNLKGVWMIPEVLDLLNALGITVVIDTTISSYEV